MIAYNSATLSHTMKPIYLILFLPVMVLCSYCSVDNCPDGINLLPMYGRVKKCPELIAIDEKFLKAMDVEYKGNRKQAAQHCVKRGWEYFYANKPDTSMMRFNQAWLLDSLNANVYWGFADLMGKQGKFMESIPLFERSLELNPSNAKILQDASNTYGQLFSKTGDQKHLSKAIIYLTKASKLDLKNVQILTQLAMAYHYSARKDSAMKYLKEANAIDPAAVDPRIKGMIMGQ